MISKCYRKYFYQYHHSRKKLIVIVKSKYSPQFSLTLHIYLSFPVVFNLKVYFIPQKCRIKYILRNLFADGNEL